MHTHKTKHITNNTTQTIPKQTIHNINKHQQTQTTHTLNKIMNATNNETKQNKHK